MDGTIGKTSECSLTRVAGPARAGWQGQQAGQKGRDGRQLEGIKHPCGFKCGQAAKCPNSDHVIVGVLQSQLLWGPCHNLEPLLNEWLYFEDYL